ncbi:MAG TPA: MmgE/PrpD family protein [Gemmatales bacterium]|nr:MmgE/PrpD family protein [Gemmatales bacterium]
MSTPNLAQRFANYAVKLRFEDIPQPVIHETKRRFIDSFATAVGAFSADAFAIAKKCALKFAGGPAVSLIGGGQADLNWGTFVNGLLIRYLDFNDTYLSKEPAHPSDNLAAVLAVGEYAKNTGKDLLTAAVLAYEIQCRLCDASSLRKNGIDHVTYGAISSALAAAKLQQFDAVKTYHTVGLAGVCNAALRQTRAGEMSMWKGAAFANAARNGVFASLLAGEGYTGPAPIFEGELGIMKLLTRETFDVAPMGAEHGPAKDAKDFMMTHTYIKFWPVEYHAQSAVDAILQLRSQIGDWRNVERIDIHTFDAAVDIIGKDPEKYRPKTRETADHSMPYCVAVALVEGDVGLESFDDAHLANEPLIELTNKVKLHRDADCNTRYPKGIPNKFTVTMKDGRTFKKEVEFPRGHAYNPMTDAEVEKKFRTVVEPVYGKGKADAMLAGLWKMDELGSDSVVKMIGWFAQ